MSLALDEVYIATCDAEIHEYAQKIGAPCLMTSDSHERAIDRAAEAMVKIEKSTEETIAQEIINDADSEPNS